MPGSAKRSRSSTTSGVITPRSSAMSGRLPSCSLRASNSAAPGPGTQRPLTAVGSPAGISQKPAKPRKWSSRMRSTSRSSDRMRAAHQA
ncbi:hypothetical protein D3C87_1761070 [compost metagenome]